MKKFMMTIAAAFVAVSMSAQMYVGGSLGFTSSSYDGKGTGTYFELMPEFGMQFSDKWGAGIEIGYSNFGDKTQSDKVTINSNEFRFAPYARFTALKLGPVNVFFDGQFTYAMGNDQNLGYNNAGDPIAVDGKYSRFGIAIKPGICYNINDKFSLVSKFGNAIAWNSSKPDGGKSTTTFSLLRLSNAVSFGFYYNF